MKRKNVIFRESEGRETIDIVESVVLPSMTGKTWRVQILKFGRSSTPPNFVYTRQTAEASKDLYSRIDVFAHAEADNFGHKPANKVVPRDKVGLITNVSVTDGGIEGDLHIFPSAKWLSDNLAYAETEHLPAPYELSIHASGSAYRAEYEGQTSLIAEKFTALSVDVVNKGAAGGRFLKMVASQATETGGGSKMKQKLLALFTLFYPTFLESKKVDVAAADENALWTYLLEADKPQSRFQQPDGAALKEETLDKLVTQFTAAHKPADPPAAGDPPPNVADPLAVANVPAALRQAIELQQKELLSLKRAQCATMLESQLTESKLPVVWQEHVRSQFVGKIFQPDELKAVIKGVRDTHSLFVESVVSNRGIDIRMGEDASDKKRMGLEGMFLLDPNRPHPEKDEKEMKESLKGIPPYRSIRQAYIDITGDVNMTGRDPNADRRFTESLATTDWTSIMAATMNRRMVRDYGMLGLDTWRSFTDVVPVTNFKQQERVRYGGYANLSTVAQRAPYLPIASPTDEKATYTPAKRGGTEDISREMLINDDVGSIVKIPQRMARAAGQTLHEFVFGFINPAVNAVIYDSAVLYITAGGFPHANYGTAALAADGVALAAAQLRMKKQAMKDNAKRLGLRARYLVVPSDLASIAYGLTVPAYGQYNNVPTFLQYQGLVPIVVDYWTDATDWCVVADRQDIVGLEIGFVNGQETPELFVSDLPSVGSYFTNDVITYKIRHEYGGAVVDFRAFDGSVVAG